MGWSASADEWISLPDEAHRLAPHRTRAATCGGARGASQRYGVLSGANAGAPPPVGAAAAVKAAAKRKRVRAPRRAAPRKKPKASKPLPVGAETAAADADIEQPPATESVDAMTGGVDVMQQ